MVDSSWVLKQTKAKPLDLCEPSVDFPQISPINQLNLLLMLRIIVQVKILAIVIK